MMNNNEKALEKLNSIVKPDPGTWKKEAQWRYENKTWIRKSQKIAFKILRALRAQKKTQKDLAAMMNVSPQQVNKWVKGKENFTLETLSRLEEALGINLLAIDNKVKKTSDYQKQIIHSFEFRSRPQDAIFHSAVKDYLKSKKSDINQSMFFSNYRFESDKFQLLFKKDLSKEHEVAKELKTLWNLFIEAQNKEKVIELKLENKAQRKIHLENPVVAEPETEYY